MKPSFQALIAAAAISTAVSAQRPPASALPFDIVEATIPQMQAALASGRVTSRQLVLLSLARIAQYEDRLNAVITVSSTALAEADALDRERAQGHVRGPLHGIPIALKDNIQTTNMPTTGGALAFTDLVTPYEATLTKHLKDAGAIILAKTVLTELANWVAGAPDPMPGNYSAVGGQGMNPYDPRPDPRRGFDDGRAAMATGGSSSGIGTAASFWAANVGTETSGSVLSPSNQNMLAGIKPTVGRISRWGVIPITADQDTPGPMARTVEDAAIMLGALEGKSPDPNDSATRTCAPPANNDYRPFLRSDALQGARVGIPRAFYYDAFTVPGTAQRRGGLNPAQAAAMQEAVAAMRAAGAVIVDPADIPSVTTGDTLRNILLWGTCGGSDGRKGHNSACSIDFAYGMKRDFNRWLRTLGTAAPFRTLTDLRWFNIDNARRGSMKYGQSRLDISDEIDTIADRARYESDRAKDVALGGAEGIDAIMKAQRLDALVFPGASGASISARPGYPTVIVPFARIPNAPNPPFPRGFDAHAEPFGVSFAGGVCSEPRLIALAYAFEQATKKRVPPSLP